MTIEEKCKKVYEHYTGKIWHEVEFHSCHPSNGYSNHGYFWFCSCGAWAYSWGEKGNGYPPDSADGYPDKYENQGSHSHGNPHLTKSFDDWGKYILPKMNTKTLAAIVMVQSEALNLSKKFIGMEKICEKFLEVSGLTAGLWKKGE